MQDPFALLDLEVRFDVDPATLEQRFLAASSRCHPDRFSDPLDQADAAERMSRVTEAYQTLRDDESRARALLQLRLGEGITSGGDTSGGDDKALPPELLMEVMEVRESLDEAVAEGDAEAIEKHRAWATEKRREHLSAIGKLFEDEPGNKNAAAIRLQLNALRYMERMLEQMPG